MNTPVTREILHNYLRCKYKGYLKLRGESGTKTDYEILIRELSEKFKLKAVNKIRNSYNDDHILQGVNITQSLLKQGTDTIVDAVIEDDIFSLHLDGLKKVSGPSQLGPFHYIPILFHEGERIREEQKLLLALCGVILGNLQGKRPDRGMIVYGQQCKTSAMQLTSRIKNALSVLEGIKHIHNSGTPPKLTLNVHYRICEFQQRCNREATKEDDLSLLRGMSEKEIKRHNSKGIFTVKQLSYTFRPKRRGKRVKTRSRPYYFSLQALAIREQKVYVYNKPNMPTDSKMQIFIDMEGGSDGHSVYLIGMLVVNNEGCKSYSFWTDTTEDENVIFFQFLQTLTDLHDAHIFYYGNYESRILKRVAQLSPTRAVRDLIQDRSTNVLSIIYSNIYFPTYSYELKEVGKYLGCEWSDPHSSGIQSIVWRTQWENSHDATFKEKLIRYNYEDCVALKAVTDFLYKISNKDTYDAAEKLRTRIVKYRTKLFEFLDHDGVPWNNNNAEHAVKHLAKYRRLVNGRISEQGLRDYLVLLSLYETCNYKGIGFLDFLLSRERDIDKFFEQRYPHTNALK